MTLLEGFRPEVADNGILLLPEHPPRLGPVSRRLIARTALLLTAQIILGSLLVFLSTSDRVRAIGLGLVFPGAGFLFSASPIGLLVTLTVMVLAVVLWWGISAHFGIPLVWWGSALLAGVLVEGPRVFTDRGTTWGWAVPAAYLAAAAAVALGLAPLRAQVPRPAGPGAGAQRVPGGNHGAGCGDRTDRAGRRRPRAGEVGI